MISTVRLTGIETGTQFLLEDHLRHCKEPALELAMILSRESIITEKSCYNLKKSDKIHPER